MIVAIDAADLALWLAYNVLPLMILFFIVRIVGGKTDEVPIKLFWWWVAFIFFCGASHMADFLMTFWAAWKCDIAVHIVAAVVSWGAVISTGLAISRGRKA